MEKIAVGPSAVGAIDLSLPATTNLRNVARAKKCLVDDLTVVILDRPRHADLIAEVRAAGARIWLIGDGDVSAALAACWQETGVDMLIGTGGAPEGVIAAAAMKCLGGDFQGRLILKKKEEIERAGRMGIKDPNKIYTRDELARGNVMFCATGVTQGTFLKGVRFVGNGAHTHSIVMRSESGTVRFIDAHHHFDSKPKYPFSSARS